MNNKKIIIILMTFSIIFTLIGGSLAYLSWQTNTSQRTLVNVTVTKDFECAIDGGKPIESSTYNLIPTTCTDEDYAIKREVKILPTLYGNNPIDMDVWIDVKDIGTGLSNSQNFKYALTTNENSCTDGVIESGTFNGKTDDSTANILSKTYTQTTTETYYLYIWLDAAETSSSTMNQSFSLKLNGSCETSTGESSTGITDPSGANAPVLDTGMIPVTISNDGTVKTISSNDNNWYDYSNKEWANAILVTESSRNTYLNTSDVTVTQSDILAYYVWIPRFKYKIFNTSTSSGGTPSSIDIVFESSSTQKSNGTAVGDYLTHPAFTFGDEELDGFWVGKFETTGTGDNPTVLPNVSSLRSQNVSTQFTTSLKFAGGTLSNGNVTFEGNSTYGLTTNTDSHMMKNSEWGAVAYLSHSIYGINEEIYINNSSSYYTGRSGGNVGGSTNTVATQYPDSGSSSTYQYYSYGYYTWLGQPVNYDGTIGTITADTDTTLGTKASTTGNITGIYDMSGGTWEYVMGKYNNTSGSSGFTTFPSSKYYDLYSITSNSSCTLATCGGHALYETARWYSDYSYFVSSSSPWFHRGGYYSIGAGAGAFYSGNYYGGSGSVFSWRSVLVGGLP